MLHLTHLRHHCNKGGEHIVHAAQIHYSMLCFCSYQCTSCTVIIQTWHSDLSTIRGKVDRFCCTETVDNTWIKKYILSFVVFTQLSNLIPFGMCTFGIFDIDAWTSKINRKIQKDGGRVGGRSKQDEDELFRSFINNFCSVKSVTEG